MAQHSGRTLGAYIQDLRSTPGFWLRGLAALAVAASLALTKGVVFAGLMVLLGLAIGLAIGYPSYRRRGRTW